MYTPLRRRRALSFALVCCGLFLCLILAPLTWATERSERAEHAPDVPLQVMVDAPQVVRDNTNPAAVVSVPEKNLITEGALLPPAAPGGAANSGGASGAGNFATLASGAAVSSEHFNGFMSLLFWVSAPIAIGSVIGLRVAQGQRVWPRVALRAQ